MRLLSIICALKGMNAPAILPPGITVHPDRAVLSLSGSGGCSTISGSGGCSTISARLVLDCMGHASPVVKQLR